MTTGWCDQAGLNLLDIEPVHVAAWVEDIGGRFKAPTVKQWLAAVRMLFDWLVVGQVLAVNPATPVRGPKHVVKVGKTRYSELLKRVNFLIASTPKPWSVCATVRSSLC